MRLLTLALEDWRRSLGQASLWSGLALEDLRDRYRRTILGLAWIVLSFSLFVVVKILIFGQLATVSTAEFGIFVTLGFGLWSYINSMVMDGCTAYTHSRPWILGTATPYPVFLLQAIYRNWIIFALTLLVMAFSLYWKPGPWAVDMLWAFPGLACYLLTSLWMSAILAPLCARYRDFHHAVQTAMRLIFFATPILWMPQQSGRLAAIASWNPLSHFVAIVREPLLYNRLPHESWAVVMVINLAGLLAGTLVYASTRRRVAHWV